MNRTHRDKYVCFDCKMAFKRAFLESANVKCCSCAKDCKKISYRIPIPPKNDSKKWEALRMQIANMENAQVDFQIKNRMELERRARNEKV